jgi:predicted CXXCH cytochrome family protein
MAVADPSWASAEDDDKYVGFILIPDDTNDYYSYKIVASSQYTLTVSRSIDLSQVSAQNTFAVVYGKLVKIQISTPNSGPDPWPVKFTSPTGPNSFADGVGAYDGICEVCHTDTEHFRNNGNGPDQLHTNIDGGQAGKDCIDCHKHEDGFAHGGGSGGTGCGDSGCHDSGNHPAHLGTATNQKLQLVCSDCHDTQDYPKFADGQDLAGTAQCDYCHSEGAASAKLYWVSPGSWFAAEGEQGFCGGCHDATPGNTQPDGSGDPAPNVMGNNSSYGFYVTGHGKDSGNYDKLSWQEGTATGNPAANKSCGDCHDLGSAHFNEDDTEKRLLYSNDESNTLCTSCHALGGDAEADPQYYTNGGDFELSAHGDNSKINPDTSNPMLCTDCHNVHGTDGAAGTYVAMTKADKQELCYQCHTDGMVENNSIEIWDFPYCWGTNCEDKGSHTGDDYQAVLTDESAGKPDWPVDSLVGTSIRNNTDGSTGLITANTAKTITATLSGGTDNHWDRHDTYSFENKVADDIQEAFGKSDKHDLGTSYTIGSSTYSLECVTCHNVHMVTGKYWEADQNKSPVTRISKPSSPSNNLQLWGDGAGEKMDDYAGGGTYRTPKNDPFTGAELPDYATFCLDCHGESTDGHANFGIDWSGDMHGQMSANSGGGACPNWYSCGKGDSWDLDNCRADDGGSSDADCWPVIPRGKGNQVFTRAPYDYEERIDGANFTLSCTDCHEAHGSDWSSMIRTSPSSGQGTIPGAGNDICATCHYYYSDWHAGFSQWGTCVASYGGCHVPEIRPAAKRGTIHGMWGGGSSGGTRTFDNDLVLHYTFDGNLTDSSNFRLDGIWSLDRHNPTAYDNSPCVGHENPYDCCTGPGTGTCYMNDQCIGLDDPHGCCTGAGTGTCDDPKKFCDWYDNPDKVGTLVAGRFGNAYEFDDSPIEVGTENCQWSTSAAYHGTWKYTEMKYNMTLEAWVYPTVDDGERKILAKHTYWSGGYALVLNKINGRLRAGLLTSINGGGGSDCDGLRGAFSTVTIPLNEWTNVAATYDYTGPDRNDNDGSVGRIRIYVNGEDVTDSFNSVTQCYTQPGVGEDAMFPHSDWNDIDPDNNCFEGHWCASALSVGGLNWSDTNQNFIGRLDEIKVWNITKDSTYFETVDSQSGPYISRVEGAEGSNELFVTFSEEVYGSGVDDELIPTDFTLSCSGKTITGVQHTAGAVTAILTLNTSLAPGDLGICTVAAGAIVDEYNTAASTDEVTILETLYLPCPTSPVNIALNEAPGSSIVRDTQSKLKGDVGGASTLTGNEFQGDGGSGNPDTIGESNYVYFGNNYGCMEATTAMTIEARIKPTGIPGGTDNSFRRIFDKEQGAFGYEFQIFRNLTKPERFPTFSPPDNVASIALWVTPLDKRTEANNGWKPVLSDYTACPITNDHWYLVKVVWNTNKPGGVPGEFFVPADIYIDDQGTDPYSPANELATENWSGYINCTDADQSYVIDDWKFWTGDEIGPGDGHFAIGAMPNKLLHGGNQFNGLIDWIIWQSVADYSGVD